MVARFSGRAPLGDGGYLYYERGGVPLAGRRRAPPDAIPLLLIRPAGGDLAAWGRFRTLLEQHLPVIAFDHRGVGGSSRLPWRAGTRQMAADVVELLDRLGCERVDVFGLSLGGMVATWLAVDAADRVHRLAIASAPLRARVPRSIGLRGALDLLECAAFGCAALEACVVRHMLSPRFRREAPAEVRRIERELRARATPRLELIKLICSGLRHDVRSELERLDAPVLALYGTHDRLLSPRARAEVPRWLPSARVEIIDGAGHALDLERPDELAARVLRFVSVS